MKTSKSIQIIREQIKTWREQGYSIGFVPTMGYLHDGHKSLIEKSAGENDKTVVSIFVNPTQFSANEDLSTYPRDFEKDSITCQQAGADLIFNPDPAEIYPEGFCSYVDMTKVTGELCGRSRPDHFRGVCTVVAKLFNIVSPDQAYFGQKDAQQLAVIKRMVKDLNFNINIVGCPIVRENDGLAMSSRNTYLNPEERQQAPVLYQALTAAQKAILQGERDAATVKALIIDKISTMPLCEIDYVEIVDSDDIELIEKIEGNTLIALAVRIGTTRLIDNIIINVKEEN